MVRSSLRPYNKLLLISPPPHTNKPPRSQAHLPVNKKIHAIIRPPPPYTSPPIAYIEMSLNFHMVFET